MLSSCKGKSTRPVFKVPVLDERTPFNDHLLISSVQFPKARFIFVVLFISGLIVFVVILTSPILRFISAGVIPSNWVCKFVFRINESLYKNDFVIEASELKLCSLKPTFPNEELTTKNLFVL